MEKYIVIVIQAYNGTLPDGRVDDVTTLQLMENDPNVALERAKTLITKEKYRVSEIIETYVKS